MKGLIYKNFFLCRASLIFIAVLQAVLSAALIAAVIMSEGSPAAKDLIKILPCFIYLFVFTITGLVTYEVFRHEEDRAASVFALSTPLGEKGFVRSKYLFILALYTIVCFCCFITDTVITGISGGSVSGSAFLTVIFSAALFMSALRLPFLVFFGTSAGEKMMSVSFVAVISIVMVYFLFGDISFLFGNDPIGDLIRLVNSGDVLIVLGIFPFVSAAAFFFSCRLSEKLFRKGAEHYE